MCGGSLKIALFSANYLPNLGGIEQYTANLAHELVKEGHSVTIVTSNVFNLDTWEELENGATVVRMPCWSCFDGRLPLPKASKEFRMAWRRLCSNRFDGVLINARFYPHAFLGVRLAELNDVRPIILDHGSTYITFGNRVLDVAVRGYEHIITSMLKRHEANYYGVSEKSVKWLKTFEIQARGVIPNSIDAEQYRLQASERNFAAELQIGRDVFKIAFVGRIIPEKGIEKLVDAIRLLKNDNMQLLVAGDGPLKSTLMSNCPTNVHFLGRLSQPDIASLLLQSDLFCLPTRSEGFCTSLLEACACGIPALITDVGGVAELIPDERYGSILPDNPSAEVIADSIVALASCKERLRAQGRACRERVEGLCSWRRTAGAVIAAMQCAR